MTQPLVRALAMIDGVLLLSILAAWRLGSDTSLPLAAGAPEAVPAAVSIRVAAPAREALGPMLERPLFVATRRPATSAPTAADEPDSAETMVLVGLAGTEDGGTAILMYRGEARRLRLGEKAGAWTLEGVEGDSARFRDQRRGTSLVLRLSRAPQPAAAPAPAAGRDTPEAEAARAAAPAGPMAAKSMAQRIAERRARREALEARRAR